MQSSLSHQEELEQDRRHFSATHWSVVLAAGHASPEKRAAALESLCRTYWEPLYAFLRRLGYATHDAEDLTQGFFAHLLAVNALDGVSPAKGKFRSFLLASLKNFLADEKAKAMAIKRGGGAVPLSAESELFETHFQQENPTIDSPDALFDRRWALTLLQEAFNKLKQEWELEGKSGQFALESPYLSHEGNAAEYESAAARLRSTPGAVAVAVHRMRLRYRELIRAEVARTVAYPGEIAGEMRYLLELICQ